MVYYQLCRLQGVQLEGMEADLEASAVLCFDIGVEVVALRFDDVGG